MRCAGERGTSNTSEHPADRFIFGCVFERIGTLLLTSSVCTRTRALGLLCAAATLRCFFFFIYFYLIDGQEASVFVFDKRTADKLHKPRRKETISEMLRHGVRQLERCRHPRLLHVLHSVEETGDTLAFATEPVATSLGNALAAMEDRAAESAAPAAPSAGTDGSLTVANGIEAYNGGRRNSTRDIKMPPPADYAFLDIEIKYGIFQVSLPFRPFFY